MTIKRRINLSFLTIAVLFAANLGIYLWNGQRSSLSADSLRRATARQPLLADIQQNIANIQKQVSLLSQAITESGAGADAAEIAQFKAQLAAVADEIGKLQALADPDMRAPIAAFAAQFHDLAESWIVFYQNFGVHHPKAIMELAVRGDPLSRRVSQEMLPALQTADRARAEAASRRYFSESEFTQRMNLLIFAISTAVGMLVGWLVLRYLVHGLNKLKEGAEEIGHTRLDFRIDLPTNDELGELATAFNEMAARLSSSRDELNQRHAELQAEKHRAETLLLNILPARAAQELRDKGSVDPKYFEDVTIMFTDFVGFTLSTEKLPAENLVHVLHDYFTAFDNISQRYGLEKLKTIGDSYMCIGGLPVRNPAHPVDVLMAAFEMVQAVEQRGRKFAAARGETESDHPGWSVRIGIHTGPVVSGVVGINKFAFDIWGDSVNFSSRMESSGAPNRINISERTYSRVKDFFECEYRGKVLTKDKREVDMYFATGLRANLRDDSGVSPPPAFVRRYRTYFEHDPPAFPAMLLQAPEAAPTPQPL
jgi:class 3 adenylate cyclase